MRKSMAEFERTSQFDQYGVWGLVKDSIRAATEKKPSGLNDPEDNAFVQAQQMLENFSTAETHFPHPSDVMRNVPQAEQLNMNEMGTIVTMLGEYMNINPNAIRYGKGGTFDSSRGTLIWGFFKSELAAGRIDENTLRLAAAMMSELALRDTARSSIYEGHRDTQIIAFTEHDLGGYITKTARSKAAKELGLSYVGYALSPMSPESQVELLRICLYDGQIGFRDGLKAIREIRKPYINN